MYKFNFIYLIRQLPYEAYKTAIKDIANICSVSHSTVRKWIYLKKDEPYDITHKNIMDLADFFNVQPKELYND